jgi:DNA-binding PucR family transcriptional regulator
VETLLASLSSRAGAAAVAELLDLHPQTVRYRLRRAESLFGDRLRGPGIRLEFEMALRAHQLLNRPRAADLPVEDERE